MSGHLSANDKAVLDIALNGGKEQAERIHQAAGIGLGSAGVGVGHVGTGLRAYGHLAKSQKRVGWGEVLEEIGEVLGAWGFLNTAKDAANGGNNSGEGSTENSSDDEKSPTSSSGKRERSGALDDGDPVTPISPLILDLDGDGVEADAITFFDHAGDGWRELSRWAGADDGVLVWDRNKDGVINDGGELFGNNTALKNGSKAANGFAALADLDSNSDGKVDSSDAEWGSLRVMRWTDANNDGVMQESESRLVTLDSLGVKSLGTSYSNSDHVDKSGNEHRQVGSYTKTDGTTAKMIDV